jgi:hypothetical protein
MKDIKKHYENACNDYLKLFCKKHGYDYDPDAWVGNDVGGIAEVTDHYVDMTTMRADIDNDAPEKELVEWYDYSSRTGMLDIPSPNFRNWLKGCPRKSDAELMQLESLRAKIEELQIEKTKNSSF